MLALLFAVHGCGGSRGTLYDQHILRQGGKRFPVLELSGAVTCYGGPYDIFVTLPTGQRQTLHVQAFLRRGIDTAAGRVVDDYVHVTPTGFIHETTLVALGAPSDAVEMAGMYLARGRTSADGAKVLLLEQRYEGEMVLVTREATPERMQIRLRWFNKPTKTALTLLTLDSLDFDGVPALLAAASAAGDIRSVGDASLSMIAADKCQEIFTHFGDSPAYPRNAPTSSAPESTTGPFKLVSMEPYHVMVLPKGLLGPLPLAPGGSETVCGIVVAKPDGTTSSLAGAYALCALRPLIGSSVMLTTVRGRIQDRHCEGDPNCDGDHSEGTINREEDLVMSMRAAP